MDSPSSTLAPPVRLVADLEKLFRVGRIWRKVGGHLGGRSRRLSAAHECRNRNKRQHGAQHAGLGKHDHSLTNDVEFEKPKRKF